MFIKEKRVPRSLFPEVLQKGKVVHGTLFSLRFAQNTQKHNRYSVIVPKTVAKNAVDRNKIRRRIYEICRKGEGTHKKPYLYVIYTKKGSALLSYEKLTNEINGLFSKIR